jgi:5-methylcytosine-specific restriction protein B
LRNRHAQVGDRVFMVKLGDPSTPRGIFASGYITSDFWEGEHFDDSKDNTIMYVDVVLTKVLDYRSDNIITIDELKQRFPEQSWSPQASGISIKVDAARWLIEQWDRPNASPSINDNTSSLEIDLDSDADSPVYTYDMIQQFHSNARFVRWLKPIVDALRELGGSASRTTVHNRIIEMFNVTRNELAQTNTSGNSQLLNDIDWARNYLAYEGIIDKSAPHGTWSLSALGKNIDLTQELAEKIIVKWVKIKAAEREGNPVPIIDLSPFYVFKIKSYSENDFLSKVYMSIEQYRELSALLLNKQNVILQGAPGVGKTYAAKRLAWSIMGEQDDSRIAFVQFHQSYSYEDFIMGYRPNGNGGFDLQAGIFYQFCETARSNPGKKHFFIIDEINRGNLSKIFGELLMLIEKDYRKDSAALAYSKEQFSVPENLYIIGMMNTADRSLAMIDYALRRRFSFFEMQPAFDSDGFKAYSKGLNSDLFEALIDKIKQLNNKIRDDDALGEGFMIGHSYFCNLDAKSCTADRLRSIVEYDIIPILKEYWFDDKDTATKQADDLRGVFHDE